MRIFKRKPKALSPRQEQRAGRIAGAILQKQRQAADYLNSRTAGISGKRWLILLILFCATFGSYCLYLLIQDFNSLNH
ncbi:hypothetical protein BDD43_2589 [Mucilaginibacter gracilis]|uniref:Uncharacterized protein n=1 Tax=Mucilaginibacter gracilis TaxID=423350 RepID=A0A495J313_9SPHI|nr:hypothetical protein [Mucilaginibacter gracilis]RKR82409.1 hypothetical protein BDD43_2589 [Mucilaginibacter gracilis]